MKFVEHHRGIEPGPAVWQSRDITIRPRWLDEIIVIFWLLNFKIVKSNTAADEKEAVKAATDLKKAAKAATDLKKAKKASTAVWHSSEITIR